MEGALPGKYFALPEMKAAGASMFYSLYFLIPPACTAMHVMVGMSVLSYILCRSLAGHYTSRYYTPSRWAASTGTSSTWSGSSCSPLLYLI